MTDEDRDVVVVDEGSSVGALLGIILAIVIVLAIVWFFFLSGGQQPDVNVIQPPAS